jgi:phosphatidylinositol-3-phosphatase
VPALRIGEEIMCGTARLCAIAAGIFLWASAAIAATWPAGLPVYDHIVIVVEENKDFEQIFPATPNPDAAILNELAADGALFTRMFAEEHHSEGNYFWLFSGSNHGVGHDDIVPTKFFRTNNLARALLNRRLTFKGYTEDLPAIGSLDDVVPAGCTDNCIYGRKHVPWISFANVPNGTTADTSSNLRFADFPTDFTRLPTVAFVIPNLLNDMHSGDPDTRIRRGDTWLRDHLRDYYLWARDHNSLLIVTFDEGSHGYKYMQLTDPRSDNPVIRNRIATIFAGARIKPGRYAEGNGINHVSILRTIEAMYGLRKSGVQQRNAEGAGITDRFIITDVFAPQ